MEQNRRLKEKISSINNPKITFLTGFEDTMICAMISLWKDIKINENITCMHGEFGI